MAKQTKAGPPPSNRIAPLVGPITPVEPNRALIEDGWVPYQDGDGLLPDWTPWTLWMKTAITATGEVIITGLMIDPRDTYDGPVTDQRITTQQLRGLPLSILLTEASMLHALRRDDTAAFMEALKAQVTSARIRRLAEQRRERAREVGEDQERLEFASAVYRAARSGRVAGGPRRAVARLMGVSLRTVDRLLAEARDEGFLPPWDGAQGKHGKPSQGDDSTEKGATK